MSVLRVDAIRDNGSTFNDVVTFANSGGTENGQLVRAWVNFNGVGTVAIRAQFNVSSITDVGTGDYTVNFTNALADANYVTVSISKWDVGQPSTIAGGKTSNITTTACSLVVAGNSPDPQLDSPNISFAAFR